MLLSLTIMKPKEHFAPTLVEGRVVQVDRFSDEARECLATAGVRIFPLSDTTIQQQAESRAGKGLPAFWTLVKVGNNQLALPSGVGEVGILPTPEDFFVPGTLGYDRHIQRLEVMKDDQNWKEKLGITGIRLVIPRRTAILTDVSFQYNEDTRSKGKWLFGADFAAVHGRDTIYARTDDPTGSSGLESAVVGDSSRHGLRVDSFLRGAVENVGVVRLFVPVAQAA